VCTRARVYVCVRACVYIHMYICLYIHVYICNSRYSRTYATHATQPTHEPHATQHTHELTLLTLLQQPPQPPQPTVYVMYVRVCVCVCVYTCIYIYIYIYICIYIYIHVICDIHIGALIEVKKRTKCEVAATEFSGILFVRVNSARNLPSLDVGSQSDPYVVVCLKDGHQKMQTKTVQNNNNAVWNETLKLNYRSLQTDVLELSVWDSDMLKAHDLIGRCQVCMCVCSHTHMYIIYTVVSLRLQVRGRVTLPLPGLPPSRAHPAG